MEFLKGLFGSGESLTFEQLSDIVKEKGLKLVDLSKGEYVSKSKYDADISNKDTQIQKLNSSISSRDDDLRSLHEQLSEADGNKTKLADVTAQLEKLQTDYATAKTDYEKELKNQKYSYAVKDFASQQKFTSEAAKREFIRSMQDKALKMEGDSIMGASDFLEQYKSENADSFAVPEETKPKFTSKLGEPNKKDEEDDVFLSGFSK